MNNEIDIIYFQCFVNMISGRPLSHHNEYGHFPLKCYFYENYCTHKCYCLYMLSLTELILLH